MSQAQSRRYVLVTSFFIAILALSACEIISQPYWANQGSAVPQSPQALRLGVSLAGKVPSIDPTISEYQVPQNNSGPLAINTDSNGNVWFAESVARNIVKYVPSSQTFHSFSIPQTPDNNTGLIWFIIFDKSGYIWFSDASQPLLWRLSPSTGQFANFSTGSQLVDPYALAYDSSTNQIWFSSTYTGQIGVFQIAPNESASLLKLISVPTPSGTYETSKSGPIIGASGLALDSQGNVFVAEAFAGAISEYSPSSSTFVGVWKLPSGSQPVGLALDEASGRIWFTNHATSDFGYVVESTGQVVEISTSLFSFSRGGYSDTITLPYWIEVAPNGAIWFDEHYGNKIAKFDPQSMQLTEFLVPTSSSSPLRFTLDNSRGLVWFTEFDGNNIGVLDQNATASGSALLSQSSASLSGTSFSLTLNYASPEGQSQSIFSPLVSGTLSTDGSPSSNFTISSQSLNSTAYRITFSRGQELPSGNYTLTICPRLSSNESESSPPPIRQCAILPLTVETQTFLGLNQIEVYALAAIVIVAILAISLTYVRRWRTA